MATRILLVSDVRFLRVASSNAEPFSREWSQNAPYLSVILSLSRTESLLTYASADIVVEVTKTLEIHSRLQSRLGGIHLELTGDTDEEGFSVTECLGGSQELEDKDLNLRYEVYSFVTLVVKTPS